MTLATDSAIFPLTTNVPEGNKSAKNTAQSAPKLNAQTLFAFGVDEFSNAFSDAARTLSKVIQESTEIKKLQNGPWAIETVQ